MIFIAVPNTGNIRSELCNLLGSWRAMSGVDVYTPQMRPTTVARNHCVEKFLEVSEHESDRLLFIDSDVVPPLNVIQLLVGHDKDVVSGSYPIIKPCDGRDWVIRTSFRFNDEGELKLYEGAGLVKVDMVGTGCLMIRRSVLVDMDTPFQYELAGNTSSEDFNFCTKLRSAGVEIWYDNDCVCDHITTVSLGRVYHA